MIEWKHRVCARALSGILERLAHILCCCITLDEKSALRQI